MDANNHMPIQSLKANLIIFDVDGTLIDVFEEHALSLDKAIDEVWGIADLLPLDKRYGIPQLQTLRLVCEASNVDEIEIQGKLPSAMAVMTEQMSQLLPQNLTDRLLPGARSLLEKLESLDNVHLVVATGTLGPTADMLLERCGLARFFPVGAYGHECDSREQLVELARKRGLEFYQLNPKQTHVVTIGDAPADILAGKSIGAYTVSVATSLFGMADLKKYDPDVLLEDLEDIDLVIPKMLKLES
jgi:phosphoglycolate phosphatase